jgi:tetratricopeptide (TPR) repeat protein
VGYAPPSVAVAKQREAALKALALDENLAAAHEMLAMLKMLGELDPPGAEPEWRRAVELDPDGTAAGYSLFLAIIGRVDEALTRIDRAVVLDPLNPGAHLFRAGHLMVARRYDEAIAEAKRTLAMAPGDSQATCVFAESLHFGGRHDEAIKAQLDCYARRWPDKPDIREAFERGYAEEGYAGAWRRAADIEAARYGEESYFAWDAAWNYMAAGDTAKALDWLEKAFAQRDPNVPMANSDPVFDPVRSDPRFQAILRRMNLPE